MYQQFGSCLEGTFLDIRPRGLWRTQNVIFHRVEDRAFVWQGRLQLEWLGRSRHGDGANADVFGIGRKFTFNEPRNVVNRGGPNSTITLPMGKGRNEKCQEVHHNCTRISLDVTRDCVINHSRAVHEIQVMITSTKDEAQTASVAVNANSIKTKTEKDEKTYLRHHSRPVVQ